MSFAALQKLVTYILAGLGLAALSFGGELSPLSLLVLGLGYVASIFCEPPLIARPSWARAWTWGVAVALALQILRGLLWEGGAWLALAMEFAGLLTVSRLCNRRSAADYQQIAMLAFIQLIAATVLTTDLGYAVLFVAFVVVTPWVLTFAHLRREIERNYPVESDARGGTDVGRVLASKRIVGLPFLLWTLLLSVPMLAMTLGLFVIFPRVGLGMVSFGNSRGQHVSGFGDNISLGNFGVIRDDPTVVVRVSSDRPLTPREEARYLRLRGTAFDHYDGRTWTRSQTEPVPMSPLSDYYPLKRLPRSDDRIFKVILERLDESVLFLPHGAVGVRIPLRGLPGSMRERVRVTRGHGFDLRYSSSDELGIVYDAIVSDDLAEFDVPVAHDMDDDRYLELPPRHERVIALARDLTKDLDTEVDKAATLLKYLRDGGRFKYSVEMPDTGDKVPLDVFLFEEKRGHCEYFATALAVMLRAVGIPARNVNGFVGGKYNRFGGYYAVTQSEAHSWVEARLSGRGWVTLDPTPALRGALGSSGWLLRDLNAVVDAMRAYWVTRVIGYDVRSQLRALRELRAFMRELSWPSLGSSREDRARGEKLGALSRDELGVLLGKLALGLTVALLGLVAVRAFRQRRRHPELGESARRARQLYLELDRVLRDKGHPRPSHLTPEAHARALEQAGFPAASAVRELTEAYTRARYGRGVMDQAHLRALKRRLKEVRRAA